MIWRILVIVFLNGIFANPPNLFALKVQNCTKGSISRALSSFFIDLPQHPISFTDSVQKCNPIIINAFIYSDTTFLGIQRLSKLEKQRLNVEFLERELRTIVKEYNRLGFPFFKIQLKPIFVSPDSLNLYVEIENYDQRVLIDTIILPADCGVSKNFVCGFFSVHEGDVFDFWKLQEYLQQVKRARFIEMKAPIQARFSSGGAILEFPLEAKLYGSFSGIVGITKSSTNKTILTGDLQFSLLNSLKQGEYINLNWKRPSQFSQFLDILAEYPYIAGSQYGFSGNIDLQKRDSSLFIMRNSFFGTLYKQRAKLSLGVDFFSGNSLSNSGQGRNSRRTLYSAKVFYSPEVAKPLSYGTYEIKFSVGKRTVSDSLKLQSPIFETIINAEHSIPFYKRFDLRIGASFGTIQTRDEMNPEELYSIGGISTLRGFDEKSLMVRHWGYSTIEFHWFYESLSSFFPFVQLGRYFLGVNENTLPKNFFSSGLGTNIELGSGVLMAIWAIGNNFGERSNFSKSKLHIGYRLQF